MPVRRIDVSQNSQHAAFEVLGKGIGVVNLSTMNVRYISSDGYEASDDNRRFAISNDGQRVVSIGSRNKTGKMFFVDESCGETVYSEPFYFPSCEY